MSDPHDTTALPRVPESPTGPAYGAGPDWHGQFVRQRRRTRILTGLVAVLALAVVGLGALSLALVRSNPLTAALSPITGGQAPVVPPGPGGSDAPTSPAAPEEGGVPGGGQETPNDSQEPPGGTQEAPGDGEQAIPLPEPLRELGARLGITDVGQLLDLAVANGLISEQDADSLRRALAAGTELGSGT